MSAMLARFYKMQATGNDFVIFDQLQAPISLNVALVRQLSSRARGVGCDQVLFLDPPRDPDHTLAYRVYNADGSVAQHCGNGACCIVWYAHTQGWVSACDPVRLEIGQRVLVAHIVGDREVRVEMGAPVWGDPEDAVLLLRDLQTWLGPAQAARLGVPHGVQLGNLHLVFFVPRILKTTLMHHVGRWLQQHPLFPKGVNVGFAEVRGPDRLVLSVYERGSGMTLSCGSGATAAAVLAMRLEHCGPHVMIQMPGGCLRVDWADPAGPVMFTNRVSMPFWGQCVVEHRP